MTDIIVKNLASYTAELDAIKETFGTKKTYGVLRLFAADDDQCAKFAILAGSGDKTSIVTTQRTQASEKYDDNIQAWSEEFPLFRFAPNYDAYMTDGIPSADKVPREDRIAAAETLKVRWSNIFRDLEKATNKDAAIKTLIQGKFSNRIVDKYDCEVLKEVLNYRKEVLNDNDMLINGVSRKVIGEYVNVLCALLETTHEPFAAKLKENWERRGPCPDYDAFVASWEKKNEYPVTWMKWMWARHTDEARWWYRTLYPDRTDDQPFEWREPQMMKLNLILHLVILCFNSNGLESMKIGADFLRCAEDNALQYAREKKLFRGISKATWTSVCWDKGWKFKALCEVCAVNFEPMVEKELSSEKS